MLAPPDFYDRLENRSPTSRESTLFRDLRHLLTISKPRVPSLRAQLKGVDIAALRTRADLAQIPVVRRAELPPLQAEAGPLGGLAATPIGKLRHLFLGADRVASVAGLAKDWWGAGRALYAAGLRKGMPVLNCFSYDLVPFGHMIESAAEAIGAPVVPAGNAGLDALCAALERYRPVFFCGPAETLRALHGHCHDGKVDVSLMTRAFVAGPSPAGVMSGPSLRGTQTCQGLVTPELGPFAFESAPSDGLIVNEALIVEIVEIGTGNPVADGADGEIVVTRVNRDYPLLRFGTGIVSAIMPGAAKCGRTNLRLRLPEEYRVDGSGNHEKRSNATLLSEIERSLPGVGRMRWREPHRDGEVRHLVVERHADTDLKKQIAELVQRLTRTRAVVELVEPGTLNDEEAAKRNGGMAARSFD